MTLLVVTNGCTTSIKFVFLLFDVISSTFLPNAMLTCVGLKGRIIISFSLLMPSISLLMSLFSGSSRNRADAIPNRIEMTETRVVNFMSSVRFDSFSCSPLFIQMVCHAGTTFTQRIIADEINAHLIVVYHLMQLRKKTEIGHLF